MENYEQILLNNEKLLFSKEFCSKEENLNNILHPSFFEYGKSGIYITREETIKFLKQSDDRKITITNFSTEKIDVNTYIVHYQSQNEFGTYALRTSIWLKEKENYRLYFHQGTPMEES